MCSYITLVVRGDASDVPAVLQRHGRKATPMENSSIRRVLVAGETQFLTTIGHCDCGTVLGAARENPSALRDEGERLRREGWSDAKIGRALRDRKKAEARPSKGAIDTIEFWAAILRDVISTPGVSGSGLLVHNYSGAIEDEEFAASRREIPDSAVDVELAKLREDELLAVRS